MNNKLFALTMVCLLGTGTQVCGMMRGEVTWEMMRPFCRRITSDNLEQENRQQQLRMERIARQQAYRQRELKKISDLTKNKSHYNDCTIVCQYRDKNERETDNDEQ